VDLQPKVLIKLIFDALSKLDYGQNDDGPNLIMSGLCIFLEGLDKQREFFPYFNIPNGTIFSYKFFAKKNHFLYSRWINGRDS